MLVSHARCIACVAWCLRFEHVPALRGVGFHVMETSLGSVTQMVLFLMYVVYSFLFVFVLCIFCVRRRILQKGGGGRVLYWRMCDPLPVERWDDYALSSLRQKINLSVICPCSLF
jgi:hypothetical protein